MAYKEIWVSGEWKANCDYCGCTYKAHELTKDWMGYMACPKDLTFRNPQDFVRPKPEKIGVDWARPDHATGTDTLVTVTNSMSPYTLAVKYYTVIIDATGGSVIINLPHVVLTSQQQVITFTRSDSATMSIVELHAFAGDNIFHPIAGTETVMSLAANNNPIKLYSDNNKTWRVQL